MRRFIVIFISIFFIFALTNCSEDKYPLNGVWSGIIDGRGEEIKITIAFIDDFCFLSYEVGNQTSSKRIRSTYENNSGNFRLSRNEESNFFVKNNILSFNYDSIPVNLSKDVLSKAAPASLNGIWKDKEDWDMVFINDRVYLNRDGTTDYGIYIFNNKEGSYTSRQYGAKVEFVLKGKELDVKVNDYLQKFSRK